MTLIPVEGSSTIAGYAWEERAVNRQLFKGKLDARAQRRERTGVLKIGFRNGRAWYYFDIPVSVFDAWQMAHSKGSFFLKFIRGKYDEKPAEEVESRQSMA